MLETHAVVVSLDGMEAVVEPHQVDGCALCGKSGGCGARKLSGLFCSQPRQFRLPNRIGARVGDRVCITLADGVLFRGAMIAYMLPLLLMLLCGMLGNILAGEHHADATALAGALCGLVIGFAVAKRLSSRQQMSLTRMTVSHATAEDARDS